MNTPGRNTPTAVGTIATRIEVKVSAPVTKKRSLLLVINVLLFLLYSL